MLSLSLLALSYTIPPLGNVLNVKDFGAKGDGTTDDTTTKTAAGADTSTFPSRALFDFDEPTKDPTGAVSQTGIHVPFFRSGTSKNWYYAARAA